MRREGKTSYAGVRRRIYIGVRYAGTPGKRLVYAGYIRRNTPGFHSGVESNCYDLNEDICGMIENELRGPKILHDMSLATVNVEVESPLGMNEEKYSSQNKLIRITAWCLRFIHNCRKNPVYGSLIADEIRYARKLWIMFVQKKYFLDGNKNFESTKYNLGVYNDKDGILKCRGRFADKIKHPSL